jgi:hypothetical protein
VGCVCVWRLCQIWIVEMFDFFSPGKKKKKKKKKNYILNYADNFVVSSCHNVWILRRTRNVDMYS